MAKKKCWFGWVNRLFISEAKTKAAEKKSKRWRWVFGRLKFKQYPALTAPQRTLNEATEEQRKHALTVAIATAAAAEAAVAAAHAAAEVVRLTIPAQSYHQWTKRDRNLAAIKIQSAFRAYLARKALRALKGLVRLQAIVRGRAVRRQTITKLKFLSSSIKMQPKVWERGIPAADGICKDGEKIECVKPKEDQEEKEIKLECNSQRRWNCSVLSKEDMEAIWIRRQEAIIKRERMMKYSYSHRERRDTHMLEETVQNKESGRRICRLQQWADTEAYNREGLEILKPTVNPNLTTGDMHGPAQVKQRNMLKHDRLTLPFSFPRRSFSRVQHDTAGDDSSIPNSPAYMTATQSAKAKAKARSMSTPKQREGFLENYFDHSLPHRNGLSFWSSYNGEPISSNGNSGASQQISASMSHHY